MMNSWRTLDRVLYAYIVKAQGNKCKHYLEGLYSLKAIIFTVFISLLR